MAETIRLGYLAYTVVEIEELRDRDSNEIFGQIAHDTCEILINARLAGPVKLMTKWHEIVHGILTNNGGYTEDHNEQLVAVVTHGILQVLRDNPHLIEELTSASHSA